MVSMTKYRCLRCLGHSACLPSALPISLLLHASPGYSLGTQIPSMRGLLPLVEEAVESLLKADVSGEAVKPRIKEFSPRGWAPLDLAIPLLGSPLTERICTKIGLRESADGRVVYISEILGRILKSPAVRKLFTKWRIHHLKTMVVTYLIFLRERIS